jgi:hypothetical protein
LKGLRRFIALQSSSAEIGILGTKSEETESEGANAGQFVIKMESN